MAQPGPSDTRSGTREQPPDAHPPRARRGAYTVVGLAGSSSATRSRMCLTPARSTAAFNADVIRLARLASFSAACWSSCWHRAGATPTPQKAARGLRAASSRRTKRFRRRVLAPARRRCTSVGDDRASHGQPADGVAPGARPGGNRRGVGMSSCSTRAPPPSPPARTDPRVRLGPEMLEEHVRLPDGKGTLFVVRSLVFQARRRARGHQRLFDRRDRHTPRRGPLPLLFEHTSSGHRSTTRGRYLDVNPEGCPARRIA